jgi:alginate O-acetyltransferase complex protein AlgJ
VKTSNPTTPPRWPDHLLIVTFVFFLLLPLLDLVFHLDPTRPPSENRLLAALPAPPTGMAGLKTYTAGWEAYFNDHFGFRKVLVMWHNKMKWSLFKEKNAREVLIGTDGWMFMTGNQMVEHFRGALQLTDQELSDWQHLLEHRRDWLAQRGIKYIFVLAPDKQSIYPEYLPGWLKDLGGRTKADQFFAYMKAHSTVPVLDLRPVLLAAKKETPVFQKTDTHWNEFGAFVACEALIRTLNQSRLPGLVLLTADSFDRTHRIKPGGDLTKLLGVRISMNESNAIFLNPKPGLPPLETFEPSGQNEKDPAFSKNSDAHGLAIVYQDSFARYWIPFLGYDFGEVDYVWQYNFDAPEIERKKPVIIVNEMVERFFDVTDPKKLSKLDALP